MSFRGNLGTMRRFRVGALGTLGISSVMGCVFQVDVIGLVTIEDFLRFIFAYNSASNRNSGEEENPYWGKVCCLVFGSDFSLGLHAPRTTT